VNLVPNQSKSPDDRRDQVAHWQQEDVVHRLRIAEHGDRSG